MDRSTQTACKCLDFIFAYVQKFWWHKTADADPKSDEKLYLNSNNETC